MTEQEIVEGNKLIAGFMGVKPVDGFYDGYQLHKAGLPFSYGLMGNGTRELNFHFSWDWIMKAVDRIDEILPDDSFVMIDYNRCVIDVYEHELTIDYIGDSRLEATYKAVVDFINLYNENKPK